MHYSDGPFDPEATKNVLDHNGYHTGDLGYKDENGYFYVSRRKDNLIKVSGHRINPQEIEDSIMGTGLVIETVIIGVPDKLKGNKLICLSVRKNRNFTENDILEKCSELLPKHKIPSEIKFIKNIPKKANGKIDQNKCIEKYCE